MIFFENLWDLYVDMSFYIVIGLILTGVLHAFVKKESILKHVGKDTMGSVVKASVVGVPLPLCSCGVVPTAMYLGQSGASKGAVVSFLTSTPQTGVDSIIATYGLMGPFFAIYRAVAAFFSGIISGIFTNILCKKDNITYDNNNSAYSCSHEDEKQTCCSNQNMNEVHTNCLSFPKQRMSNKIKSIFTYAFGEFLDEISFHFVVGLIIAALISTLLPQEILSSFTNPFLSMLLMLVIGIPMYICSTASIPVALSLMMKGISPGAAFVFLFAGPVTNIASLTVLAKILGKKVLAIYLGSVAICSIGFGFLLDYIIKISGYSSFDQMMHNSHEHEVPIYMVIVAILFGILVIKSLIKKILNNKKSCCSNS